jgi:hypothetical protein
MNPPKNVQCGRSLKVYCAPAVSRRYDAGGGLRVERVAMGDVNSFYVSCERLFDRSLKASDF